MMMMIRRWIKRLMPLAVSIGLLTAVVWWVSPEKILAEAREIDWRILVPVTAVMVVALYFWDALCLPAVYGIDGHRITYRQALGYRGLSYLGGALNYGLGQAALSWGMARVQRTGLVLMLARSVLLAYHDAVVLLAAGFAGSLFTDDPRVARLRPFIAGGLIVAVAIGVLVWALPARVRIFKTQSFLEGWSARRSARLLQLRFVFFAILVVYASVALRICRIPVDSEVVVSTVPLVLLADGLPNFAGLGTREASLPLLLINPDEPATIEPATLVAMSFFWSSGMIIVRFVIALVNVMLYQWHTGSVRQFLRDAQRAESACMSQQTGEQDVLLESA